MDANELIVRYQSYQKARSYFLDSIGRAESNRDPLSEFSELLVEALTHGTLAPNPVQKDYDVVLSSGEKVQVKYLANPKNENVNGLEIRLNGLARKFAVVYFEDLALHSVLLLDQRSLATGYDMLLKRHKGRGEVLVLTKANVATILAQEARFKDAGIEIIFRAH